MNSVDMETLRTAELREAFDEFDKVNFYVDEKFKLLIHSLIDLHSY